MRSLTESASTWSTYSFSTSFITSFTFPSRVPSASCLLCEANIKPISTPSTMAVSTNTKLPVCLAFSGYILFYNGKEAFILLCHQKKYRSSKYFVLR